MGSGVYRYACSYGFIEGASANRITAPDAYIGCGGLLTKLDLPRTPLTLQLQPYLDSDMQSRWWDFGGNTIVRVDKYGLPVL